jgi:heme/copper-type cytochrome/quinol oxidase subunit 3
MSETTAPLPEKLPFGSIEKLSTGWWGLIALITTEACLFGYLIFAYGFAAVNLGPTWLPPHPPELKLAGPNTVVLLLSSVAVWWGERGMKKRGSRGQLFAGYGVGFLLGLAFVLVQLREWASKTFTLRSDSYAGHFFVTTGFHMAHVIAGLIGLSVIMMWNALGYFDRERNTPVAYVSIYWHFVDAVWLVVFTTFYLTPRL